MAMHICFSSFYTLHSVQTTEVAIKKKNLPFLYHVIGLLFDGLIHYKNNTFTSDV